mgnify:FL=1
MNQSFLQFKNRLLKKRNLSIHTGNRTLVSKSLLARVRMALVEKIITTFTWVRVVAWSKNSFSFLKKNFFNFGLETIFFMLVLSSAIINLPGQHNFFSTYHNRYLAFLLEHPQWNEHILNQIKTENIQATLEKESLISQARAATLYPLNTDGVSDSSKTADGQEVKSKLIISSDSVLVKPNIITKEAGQSKEIHEYTVKSGDSVARIANNFGVSAQTILYENKLAEDDLIRPGQVLKILPTTGIKHTVAASETVEQIAKKYQADMETILVFNEIEVAEDIMAGETLIIPDAKFQISTPTSNKIASYNRVDVKTASAPPDFIASVGAFVWPLTTHNITQYFSSRHRALDISNGQRPQFWTANGGIVELSGWDGAYGRSVVINHGDGVKTRYGHASELYVSAGDYVSSGQVIGRVGNTGRVFGATGNHLHFEIIRNGTKINPLTVVK